jgi:hypothetical protein
LFGTAHSLQGNRFPYTGNDGIYYIVSTSETASVRIYMRQQTNTVIEVFVELFFTEDYFIELACEAVSYENPEQLKADVVAILQQSNPKLNETVTDLCYTEHKFEAVLSSVQEKA